MVIVVRAHAGEPPFVFNRLLLSVYGSCTDADFTSLPCTHLFSLAYRISLDSRSRRAVNHNRISGFRSPRTLADPEGLLPTMANKCAIIKLASATDLNPPYSSV
jgi:hypothetical protein